MSFWNDEQRNTSGTFESGGGDFEPIPANTGCIAAIKQAGWAEYQGDRYINIQWQVLKPDQYKNRVIFQKIRVLDNDPAKADRAKRMLAAIDANAGGKLLQLSHEPTDHDLASALTGKMQAIKLQVWEMEVEGQQRSGNWVSAVAPSKGGQQQPAAVQQPATQPVGGGMTIGDDIPFAPVSWIV